MPGQAKSQGNEPGTAPPGEPASNADLVYEAVDDGWTGYDESHVHLPRIAGSPTEGPGTGPPPIRTRDRIFWPKSLTDLPENPQRGPCQREELG
jgi:hypothetical protein